MDLITRLATTIRVALGLPEDPGEPPDLFRLGLYRSQVIVASPDGKTLDVQPEDARVPGQKSVPIRVGIPGSVAVVQPGAVVLLGWERGDPRRPYCVPSWEDGATVTKLIFNAQQLLLGSASATEPVPLGNIQKTALQNLNSNGLAIAGAQLTAAAADPIFSALMPVASAAVSAAGAALTAASTAFGIALPTTVSTSVKTAA